MKVIYYVKVFSRMAIGLWILLAFPLLCFGQTPNLSGFGTPTIDGELSPGEWVMADSLNFEVVVPQTFGGGTVPGTMFVMNDLTNLYLAVEFMTVALRNSAAFEFDNDNSGGPRESGDDVLLINPDPSVGFLDEFRSLENGIFFGRRDTDDSGTNDGAGAFSNIGGSTIYEFSHPLDSEDNAHDFSLALGDIVPFNLFITLLDERPGTSFPDNTGTTDLFGGISPSDNWGSITIAFPLGSNFGALDSRVYLFTGTSEHDRFSANGSFTLGDESNGIDPVLENIVLSLADTDGVFFQQTLSAGSFRPYSGDRGYIFWTSPEASGIHSMTIKRGNREGEFTFSAIGRKLDLDEADNQAMTVSLRIGDDGGSKLISCRIFASGTICE